MMSSWLPLRADQFQVGRSPIHQSLDNLATPGPAIDIVAEGNDCRRSIRLRVLNDLRYRFRKEVAAPMQIGNCVGKRHHFTSITSTSAARTCRRMSAAISLCLVPSTPIASRDGSIVAITVVG